MNLARYKKNNDVKKRTSFEHNDWILYTYMSETIDLFQTVAIHAQRYERWW